MSLGTKSGSQTTASLLSAEEVGAILGITEQTLAHWRSKRIKLPFIRVGSRVRYRPEDIAKFTDENLQNVD